VSAARHTPGPWRIGDAGFTVFGPPNGNPAPEVIAPCRHKKNTALIAAAPDLLAACKSALVDLERLFPDRLENLPDTAQYAVARRLQAVILKAEGGAK
jgi:hypothetical protein